MINKYFKLPLLILALMIGLGAAAQAVSVVIPANCVLNPNTDTLYAIDNDKANYNPPYSNHEPRIKIYTKIESDWQEVAAQHEDLEAGSQCYGMALSKSGDKLLVGVSKPGNSDEIRIYNIDQNNGYPSGSGSYSTMNGDLWFSSSVPGCMAAGSNNRLFVTDQVIGRFSIYDTSNNTFIKTVTDQLAGKANIYGIAASSPPGNTYKIYVSCKAANGEIYVYNYNSSNNNVSYDKTITGLQYPTYLKVVGDKLYVAVNGVNGVDILVYDTTDDSDPQQPIGQISSGVIGVYGWTAFDVSSNGNWLFFKKALDGNESNNTLYRVKLSKGYDAISEVASVNRADGVALSSDISLVALTYSPDGAVNGEVAFSPPEKIKNFDASDNEDSQSTLTWTNPADADEVLVVRVENGDWISNKPSIDPDGIITNGVEVYRNSNNPANQAEQYVDTGLTNYTYYYYAAFTKNADDVWNTTVDEVTGQNGNNADIGYPGAEDFQIIWTYPADLDTDVPLNAPIVIKFNQEVNINTLNVNITPSVPFSSYTWSEGNSRVAIEHTTLFNTSTTYTVAVSAQNTTLQSLTGDTDFQFTTSNDPNKLAPYIVETTPVDGAQNVFLNQPVIIKFSQPMNEGSVSTSCTPDPGGWSTAWSGNSTVATLSHTNFAPTTAYEFEVTAATGSNGVALIPGLVPNPFDFETGTGTTTIIYNVSIQRDGDNQGDSVTISWEITPSGGVDIYQLICNTDGSGEYTSYFTTNSSLWGAPIATNQTSPYTISNQVGTGTAEYYKLMPTGTPLQGSDLATDVVGKFDIMLSEGFNFISVPIEMSDSAIADVVGLQLTGGIIPPIADKVYKFKQDKSGFEQAWLNSNDSKWYDVESGLESTMTIDPDTGYWIELAQGHSNDVVSIVGLVPETNRGPLSITIGFNLMGSNFPVQVTLEDTEIRQSGATAGIIPPLACKVYSFKPDKSGFEQAWLNSNDNKWYDVDSGLESTMLLSPGKAFWIEEPNSFSWIYPKPY